MLDTTPKDRLLFYEYAIKQIAAKNNRFAMTLLCATAARFFEVKILERVEFMHALPELYERRTVQDSSLFWKNDGERYEALNGAIEDVKKLI